MTRYQKPGKEAFYSDMNKHARADYRHVGERYILEVDPFPTGDFRLIVWEAVRQGGEYVRPSDFRKTRLAVEIQKLRDANHSRETKPYEITGEGISVYQQANIF
jgi:KaiC/GvpD/RAD55 family RecA-like ATPase